MTQHKPFYICMQLLAVILIALPAAAGSISPPQPASQVGFPDVQPVASYDIDVSLDVQAKTLAGKETLTYLNTTQEPFTDLVFHLYLNAFRDDTTIFFKESGAQSRGFSWDPQHPGWIEVTDIRLKDGAGLRLELLEDGTLARAELPEAVGPGQSVQVELSFNAQLPRVFARTGFVDDFFMVGQWFPKLGVWEEGGWNAYPFHSNSEFYADFGNYRVDITLPSEYVTGGVGLPAGERDNGDGTKSVSYEAEAVIDFAWTASPHFKTTTRQVGGVEILYMYLPEHEWTIENVLGAAEASIRYFGEWFGAYPYPRLTVVDVPDEGQGAGGMEYPTLITAGAMSIAGDIPVTRDITGRSVETVTAHEAGHQWWQSMVAFNEAEEPWLDEGFTDYSSVRLMENLYPQGDSMIVLGDIRVSYLESRRFEYINSPNVPMYGKAWDFEMFDYGVAAYSKPVMALYTLEGVLGEETMLRVMSTFFQRYQFKHPDTEDFRKVAEEVSGQDLDWFFDGMVYGAGTLNYTVSLVEEHSVTVAKEGRLEVPVEVLVEFSDGSTELESWAGVEASKTFSYPNRPAIDSAEVDPDRKVIIDLNWSDNGLARRAQIWPWIALVTRMLYQLQNAMLALGGL
ncbi:MAG: M1 family peptidase [Chloroflexota bacterium]|nr:MAG: M1 family peptidase [Chloroflexota bacterium]